MFVGGSNIFHSTTSAAASISFQFNQIEYNLLRNFFEKYGKLSFCSLIFAKNVQRGIFHTQTTHLNKIEIYLFFNIWSFSMLQSKLIINCNAIIQNLEPI